MNRSDAIKQAMRNKGVTPARAITKEEAFEAAKKEIKERLRAARRAEMAERKKKVDDQVADRYR